MVATALILSAALAVQAPAAVPKEGEAPAARAMSPAERARIEREALIAKRKAGRLGKAQAQATRRGRAAEEEAKLRDYEMKMAPIVAAQQVEMAKIRSQEQQAAFQQQAIMNAQQMQAARLAQENYRLQLEYWRSQRPVQVIIENP